MDKMKEKVKDLNPRCVDLGNASKRVVDFRDVTRHSPPYEVCRMFLASLSLSNSGNIHLVGSGDDCTSLQIELLSSDIERPMETYLARAW